MNKQSNAHRRKHFLISIIYLYYYSHIVRNLISVNCRRINSKKRPIAGYGPLGRLEMRCMKARPRWFVMTIYSQKSLVSSSVWSVIIWLHSHETFNVKSLLRISQSAMSRAIQCILICINYSHVYFTKLTKDSKNSNCASPDKKNHWKTTL